MARMFDPFFTLSKPFQMNELLAKVREVLDEKQQLSET